MKWKYLIAEYDPKAGQIRTLRNRAWHSIHEAGDLGWELVETTWADEEYPYATFKKPVLEADVPESLKEKGDSMQARQDKLQIAMVRLTDEWKERAKEARAKCLSTALPHHIPYQVSLTKKDIYSQCARELLEAIGNAYESRGPVVDTEAEEADEEGPSTVDQERAYQEGYRAYTGRWMAERCPYTPGTQQREQWYKGYHRARLEQRLKDLKDFTGKSMAYKNGWDCGYYSPGAAHNPFPFENRLDRTSWEVGESSGRMARRIADGLGVGPFQSKQEEPRRYRCSSPGCDAVRTGVNAIVHHLRLQHSSFNPVCGLEYEEEAEQPHAPNADLRECERVGDDNKEPQEKLVNLWVLYKRLDSGCETCSSPLQVTTDQQKAVDWVSEDWPHNFALPFVIAVEQPAEPHRVWTLLYTPNSGISYEVPRGITTVESEVLEWRARRPGFRTQEYAL